MYEPKMNDLIAETLEERAERWLEENLEHDERRDLILALLKRVSYLKDLANGSFKEAAEARDAAARTREELDAATRPDCNHHDLFREIHDLLPWDCRYDY